MNVREHVIENVKENVKEKEAVFVGKIEMKKQQKREALLKAAYELFLTKGIQDTSIADIVKQAGIAKGTFYLYFNDKYEVRDYLISKKAGDIIEIAHQESLDKEFSCLEERILFWTDCVINQLKRDKACLKFIDKNLSWGVFKTVILEQTHNDEGNLYKEYLRLVEESGRSFRNPDIMLYMIIELVGATCHSAILFNEPVSIEELKPELYGAIRQIVSNQEQTDKE